MDTIVPHWEGHNAPGTPNVAVKKTPSQLIWKEAVTEGNY